MNKIRYKILAMIKYLIFQTLFNLINTTIRNYLALKSIKIRIFNLIIKMILVYKTINKIIKVKNTLNRMISDSILISKMI
jgi:hypothetical protein